jgi:small multidrug resistance family-3 protein
MIALIYYIVTAVAEIGGCYAFWAWLRLGKSVYWVIPGTISLVMFSILLTRIEGLFAGRVYAAYGGVYIVACLLWLWFVEGQQPDKSDTIGSIICIVGVLVILFGQRQQA